MMHVIKTDGAPAAIGPYSQAIVTPCQKMVFCSGQIALDPASGALVGSSAAEQCRQVLKNLRAVLRAAGTDLGGVVKTTIYLTDIADFAAVNEAYAAHFPETPPARAAVAVSNLPKGAKVMIDAVAV